MVVIVAPGGKHLAGMGEAGDDRLVETLLTGISLKPRINVPRAPTPTGARTEQVQRIPAEHKAAEMAAQH